MDKNVVLQLLGSKKFLGSLMGIVFCVLTAVLPEGVLTAELKGHVIVVVGAIVGVYVFAQGKADEGKSAEQIRDKRARDMESGGAE